MRSLTRLGGAGLLAGALVLGAACASPAAAPAPAKPASAPAAASAPTTAAAPAASAPAPAAPTPVPVAEARPPVQVKVGMLAPNMAQSGVYIALDRGYFREQGLDIELVNFSRGLEMIPPLSTNQIQVATGSAGAGMFNAVSQGVNNRVVADAGSAQPGAGAMVVMYRRDLYDNGTLVRPEQLRGKSVAVSGLDAVQEFTTLGQLVPFLGLQPSDVSLTPLSFPDMVAGLANRSVDSAFALEPFASTMVARDLGVRGITAGEVNPGTQIATKLYGEEFARNRPVAEAWMVAYVRALRDYHDAIIRKRGPDEAIQILEKWGVVPNREALDSMTVFAFNPNGAVYQDNLAAMQDYFVRKGSVKQPIALAELIDNSFVEHAVRVLGEYR